MSLAATAAASRLEEVEAGGFLWRIKRIRSVDVIKVGYPLLTIIGRSEETGEAMTAAEVADRAGNDPSALASMVTQRDALVAAGVVAFAVAPLPPQEGKQEGEPEEPVAAPVFEPVCLVLHESDEDPEAGRLWVETFDQRVRMVLWTRIMELSAVEGQSASRALRAFRG